MKAQKGARVRDPYLRRQIETALLNAERAAQGGRRR